MSKEKQVTGAEPRGEQASGAEAAPAAEEKSPVLEAPGAEAAPAPDTETAPATEGGFDIREELKKIPERPGVYIMHDRRDAILYVGKAINLRRRVHQYFVKKLGRGPKIERMVGQIARFEYIVTDSELEALVLENNLIKEHRPRYNTLLKDDKTYPYICVTADEDYPQIRFTRKVKRDRAKYFGPYKSAAAVKDTIELLRRLYRIRDCSRRLPQDIGKERPCLNYQIGQCDAPCQGYITREAYRANVEQVLSFLGGNYAPVLKLLEERMKEASSQMDFENAALWRDLRASVAEVAQKQKITATDGEDKDILALATDEGDCVVQVFFVRGGRLIGRDHFFLRVGMDAEKGEILSDFIRQFYAGTPFIPRELLTEVPVPDSELLEEWLGGKRGGRVYLRYPQRGVKEKLAEMAHENAEIVLRTDRERIRREESRTIGAMQEIADLLGLEHIGRAEAYDISNTSGVESVGSMVVFENGRPKKNDYRKFRIRTVQGPNDYASMKEVLERRFAHGLKEREELAEKGLGEEAGKFTAFPDLIMMDGGKGQVHVAEEVLREMGLAIPVCGMVKDDFHRTRGLYWHDTEVPIDTHSEGFKLITRVQDEAHRFAIEFHRSLRSKAQTHSLLEDIPGIGPARRKALLRAFGSLEAVRDASLTELTHAPSMNERSARQVYAFFHPVQDEEEGPAAESTEPGGPADGTAESSAPRPAERERGAGANG